MSTAEVTSVQHLRRAILGSSVGWPNAPLFAALVGYLSILSNADSPETEVPSTLGTSQAHQSATLLAQAAESLAEATAALPDDPAAFDPTEFGHCLKSIVPHVQMHLLLDRHPAWERLFSTAMDSRQLGSIKRVMAESIRIVRLWLVHRPELVEEIPTEVAEFVLSFRIPWWAYLRAMWNLFWSANRHPFSETTIDLSTGRVLYRT